MTPHSAHVEVLIAGAGPTGLTLACALACHGISPLLVDSARSPARESSRATIIHPATLERLQRLGVAERVVQAGIRVPGVCVCSGSRVLIHQDNRRLKTGFPFLLNIAQADTEAQLTAHVESLGASVIRGTAVQAVTGFERESEPVAVELEGSTGQRQRVLCRYVIGCDGAHSTVRHALGLPFEGSAYPERFVLADLQLQTNLNLDENYLFVSTDGPLALSRLPHGVYRLNATLDETAAEPSTEGLDLLIRRRAGDSNRTRIKSVRWSAEYREHRRIIPSLRRGAVFLCGDAAHVHSPIGGQGMNLGMQDGFDLGWKLALVLKGHASDRLLDTYGAERLSVAQRVLAGTDRLNRLVTTRQPLRRLVLNQLMWVMGHVPSIRARAEQQLAGLTTSYNRSPAVGEHWAAGKPPRRRVRAGDRLPYGALRSRGGSSSLHDVVGGLEHHLLLLPGTQPTETDALIASARQTMERYRAPIRAHLVLDTNGPAPPPSPEMEVLFDGERALRTALGSPPGPVSILIRPDGHVGWLSDGSDHELVRRHLDAWLATGGSVTDGPDSS